MATEHLWEFLARHTKTEKRRKKTQQEEVNKCFGNGGGRRHKLSMYKSQARLTQSFIFDCCLSFACCISLETFTQLMIAAALSCFCKHVSAAASSPKAELMEGNGETSLLFHTTSVGLIGLLQEVQAKLPVVAQKGLRDTNTQIHASQLCERAKKDYMGSNFLSCYPQICQVTHADAPIFPENIISK